MDQAGLEAPDGTGSTTVGSAVKLGSSAKEHVAGSVMSGKGTNDNTVL